MKASQVKTPSATPEVHRWASGCRGKLRYPSRRAANAARRVMGATGRAKNFDVLHPYKCPACKHWHLGNEPGHATPAPLKRIRVARGDVVEITWRGHDGTEERTIHKAPEKKA